MIYTPILKPFRLNKKGAIDATYECATMAEAVANAYEGYFCYVKADKLHYKFILVNNVLTAVRDVAVDASVLATKTEVDAKAAKTYVDAELAKKSDTAHTHPYAPLAHDHGTLYVRAADLQPYALASDMAQRAMTNHNHDTAYSALNHAHDTAYSALIHNHDSSYIAASVLSSLATRTEVEAKAALNHTHTNVYAEFSHIHANYADIGHLHDERYITRAEVVSAGGVQQYVHPTTDGNHHVPATGTSNNGKFLKSGALAGSEAWQSITAADVTTNADSRFTSDTELSTIVSNATNAIATARSEAITAAATDATTKADTAKNEAIAAAATDATTKADTARSEAIAAAASDATTKADTARSEAITAAATDATTKADTARSEAIAAAATDATTKADTAKSEAIAAAATDATTKVNSLKIGGRNLLRNSTMNSSRYYGSNGGISYGLFEGQSCLIIAGNMGSGVYTSATIPIIAGEYYTVSADVYADSSTNLYWGFNSNNVFPSVIGGKWTRVSALVQCTLNDDFVVFFAINTVSLKLRNLKLEKGTVSTDWTPAPEDVDEKIADAIVTAQNYTNSALVLAPYIINPATATTYTLPANCSEVHITTATNITGYIILDISQIPEGREFYLKMTVINPSVAVSFCINNSNNVIVSYGSSVSNLMRKLKKVNGRIFYESASTTYFSL